LHNKADAEKRVLVLQPITNGFELIEPAKPSEKAKDEYRFEVPVPANKTTEFKTVTERTYSETAALLTMNIDTLLVYSRNEKISPKLKSALEEIVRRRNALTDIQNQRKALQDQIKSIDDDQDRIRQNMNSLPRDSDLYKTYMAKLTSQETQLENLHQQIKKQQDAETAANQALSDYVQNLDIAS
jgi:chromosome segregation ATPase